MSQAALHLWMLGTGLILPWLERGLIDLNPNTLYLALTFVWEMLRNKLSGVLDTTM
jgi:hypothetical protein